MELPVRKSIKILLINKNKELLLMCVDDPKTTSIDGKHYGIFWCPIGGGIKPHETIQEAATREIYEETGIKKEEIELGPVVWFGEFDLVLAGTPTHVKEKFIVAKTKQKKIAPAGLTDWEQKVIKKIEWLSLEKIKSCKEVVFPVLLSKYLPDILDEQYPEKPIEIDLGEQP
jgi:8-oxo-dGTP pyrophosphatase MutT (NUDIX family)